MAELLHRQQKLWQLLTEEAAIQPMLRISREDDCLWVCDLPRRADVEACEAIRQQAENTGFVIHLQEATRLWQIDLCLSDPLFGDAPALPLPKDENRHAAYGLYRLLKAHPSQPDQQPLPLLRAILKLTLKPHQGSQAASLSLTSQCAVLLNRKQPLPSAACNALAQWICQEDEP